MKIREYLKDNILITDGAMGTYFSVCYPMESEIVEKMNLSHPDRIKGIHLEYLQAGARLLRTNSFLANSLFFDDESERENCIRSSYLLAKNAVEEFKEITCREKYSSAETEFFIAADLGTLYDIAGADYEQAIVETKKSVDIFFEAGADIFMFETQADLKILFEVAQYIKEKSPEAFIIATFSADKTHYTKAGLSIDRIMRELAENDFIDAYGFNCGMDNIHMRDAVKELSYYTEKPFAVLPNAGYPYLLRGKPIYTKNEAYWSENVAEMVTLGGNIIGGCCGTTPEHIKRLTQVLTQKAEKELSAVASYHLHPVKKKIVKLLQEDNEERTFSAFYKKLNSNEKAFVVELDPPFDTDASKVFEGAKLLKQHDVDILTLSDSPMGRSRMDSSLLGSFIQNEVGISVMPHISCRDRNTIGLRGTMLGNYYAGLRHFLIVTGDPVPQNDRGSTTPVFDYNSIRFMSIIHEMNADVFQKDTVLYGGALNYNGANPDAIANRMKKKMEEGCAFFLTQPIYSDEDIERIKYLKSQTNAKICAGIMPLVSYKNALFLKSQMPGIKIPDEIINAYQPDMSRQESEEVAIRISLEIACKLKDVADAYYFMTPFNRVNLIVDIIEKIRENL